MSKVFVITGSNGNLLDKVEWNICVVHTEERAKEIVDKLNRFKKYEEDEDGLYPSDLEEVMSLDYNQGYYDNFYSTYNYVEVPVL